MNQAKLYVGSLAYGVTKEELNEFFSAYGEIKEATVIMDRATGQSKGFGFVTFSTSEAAQHALNEANGKDLKGRSIKVSLAKEDTGRSGGGGGGGDRGGFGGGRPPRREGGFGGGGGGGSRW